MYVVTVPHRIERERGESLEHLLLQVRCRGCPRGCRAGLPAPAAAAAFLLCAGGTAVQAHEFIVTPSAASVKAGAPLAVSVLSSHVFMKGEELEKAEDLRVGV